MTEAMHAIRIARYGDPSVLTLENLPLPFAGEGQVLLAVKAAGVNFFDTQMRSGLYKIGELPLILGNEGAGTVLEVGPDVHGLAIGDRVAWAGSAGAYASHAVVPVNKIVMLPDTLDFEVAAAGLFQGLTAHYLSHSIANLASGTICLVHSAAGGVGQLLCQMARWRGAKVIGTVSDLGKAPTATRAGAEHVFSYLADDFITCVREVTGGTGVDVVFDAVGLETFEKSLAVLRSRGLLALYGEASGLVPPFDVRTLAAHGSLMLTRTGLKDFIQTPEEYRQRASDVLGWLASGKLKLQNVERFPLFNAEAAHRALESRRTTGKVLLIP